jgi:hypothetical protein
MFDQLKYFEALFVLVQFLKCHFNKNFVEKLSKCGFKVYLNLKANVLLVLKDLS